MKSMKNVQLNLAIPEHYRNLLRRMAAERVMKDPSEVATGASIATELLLRTLKDIASQTNINGGTENE